MSSSSHTTLQSQSLSSAGCPVRIRTRIPRTETCNALIQEMSLRMLCGRATNECAQRPAHCLIICYTICTCYTQARTHVCGRQVLAHRPTCVYVSASVFVCACALLTGVLASAWSGRWSPGARGSANSAASAPALERPCAGPPAAALAETEATALAKACSGKGKPKSEVI